MVELMATQIARDGVPDPLGQGRRVVLKEHPLRLSLTNEVHARPYEVLPAPVRATHLAVVVGEQGGRADREHLLDLCDRFGVAPPPPEAIHYAQLLWPDGATSTGTGALRLRWERHTEFSTYTFYRFDDFSPQDPFAETALDMVPADWLADLPGEVLVAVNAAVCPPSCPPSCATSDGATPSPNLTHVFGEHLVVGSAIGAGAGKAWTDFRLHSDGLGRVLMHAGSLTPGQVGRMLQRLFELETYRMMALLALPAARRMGPVLSRLEKEVASLVALMTEGQQEEDRLLLDRLIEVAAEVEQVMAEQGYRFGATKAYHALVDRCVQELRETRMTGSQTFAEFMDRRFSPAMRTCLAMSERADSLGRRVARTADMLRTRVDITLEENNRDLLHSMNRRADLQLRLQETVEGLSVVAISYYLWSLVAYLLKGVKAFGVPLNPDIAALVVIPLVMLMVWQGVRQIKAAVGQGDAGQGGH